MQQGSVSGWKQKYGPFSRGVQSLVIGRWHVLEAVWEIGFWGCHGGDGLIQALDVDATEPGADGPDCQEDETLSQRPNR